MTGSWLLYWLVFLATVLNGIGELPACATACACNCERFSLLPGPGAAVQCSTRCGQAAPCRLLAHGADA